MKHSSVRNVIECAFNILKGRWAILHRKSYYSVQVQCRTRMASCLLHNLINREMMNVETEASNEWTQWRDSLAEAMFSEWQLRNH